ncbi:MAG: ABC transporter ATP-binding protein [Sandaracinaceae bacterium]|nr:ABC transporter ATP-binding protein [Sandaracinaceae bacterium]
MSALVVEGLRRDHGAHTAVSGLSFAVAPGELYGLVGPDGAGKSTTIGCLAGLMRPSAGSVRVLGEDPMARGSHARERLGLMPQEYSLYGDLTIAENLRFFGQLFGLPRRAFDERRARLLGITRLARFEDRRADALSGGMYKKLALACALLHRPDVLLLDEPTNGVDPVSRRELWALVHELVGEGMAVLLSTPYMDEAARCHRVGLMHEGHLIAEGEPGALTDALEHEVFELEGGEREVLHAVLTADPDVVAASPAGERLRVVVAPGAGARLAASLAAHGTTLRRVPPDFEDLFLARVAA